MDDKLRARLERRADRLEHRLGVIHDPETNELRRATVSEVQARTIRLGGAAANYASPGVPDDAGTGRDDEYDDEHHRETVTERQVRQMRGGV